jgi:hypothetical protein
MMLRFWVLIDIYTISPWDPQFSLQFGSSSMIFVGFFLNRFLFRLGSACIDGCGCVSECHFSTFPG